MREKFIKHKEKIKVWLGLAVIAPLTIYLWKNAVFMILMTIAIIIAVGGLLLSLYLSNITIVILYSTYEYIVTKQVRLTENMNKYNLIDYLLKTIDKKLK